MISKEEYKSRVQSLSQLLSRNSIDAVLLTAESNIDYFSGYRHHAPWTLFARPFFELISADGRSVVLTHAFLEPEARRTCGIDDVRAYSQSGGAPIEMLFDIFKELGLKQGRLGMELGYEQRLGISIEDFERIKARDGIELVDISDLVWQLRMIKSPAEIELLKKSTQINEEAFRACFEQARPGMTEQDVARIAARRMIECGAERPGFILVTSGWGNYGTLSGKPTNRVLQKEEMLWIDMGAVYQGYWSDFCRAAVLGPPQPEHDRNQAIINEVNHACVEAASAGAIMRDVAAAAEKALQKNGVDVSLGQGRVGHGIGLMSTEPPHVALYDETPCQEGLIFTIEPRFITDKGVYNCEELILISRDGPQILTSYPREIQYMRRS